MSFFYILKNNNFDWEKSRDIFYGLTEPQIMWFNIASAKEARRIADEQEKESNRQNTGFGGTTTHKKSFDLRSK